MNFEGKLVGKNLKVAIVVSRFNDFYYRSFIRRCERYINSS